MASNKVPAIVLGGVCFLGAGFFFHKAVQGDAKIGAVTADVVEIKKKREFEFRNCIFLAAQDKEAKADQITACLTAAEKLHPLPGDQQ